MRKSPKQLWLALPVCLAILAAAVVAQPAAQEQSEAMQAALEAEKLLQAGDNEGALAGAAKAIELDENLWQAYWIGGYAYQNLGRSADAYEYFVKVTELNPGFGMAHRFASMTAAANNDLEASWAHAIKAHQSGTDMSDAFAGLQPLGGAPDDLEAQLAAYRVFVGPFDTTVFQEQGDTALQGGANAGASGRTDVGQRVVQEATLEILNYQQEARRQIAESRSFGLVGQQNLAQFIFVTEVDYIQDSMSRRSMRGIVKLVDVQTGEEAYRRRVEFANIVSPGDLNRDFSQLIRFMEEWAAEQQR